MHYFQNIIRDLESFWSEQGCVILHSYDLEVGAGTLSPYTALEVIRREEWKACYTQYCRRPTDGREGENPNRLSGYFQFQVILKPHSSNVQEVYLKSLERFGISPSTHDIRFIEDNWENPSIGAAGLGFEVWINGMECSQWTYMQQMGGVELKTTPCEITYGLERIAMYVQDVESIFDIQWSPSLKYRDIFLDRERQRSTSYKTTCDIDTLKGNFSNILQRAEELTSAKLFYPAYEECLKASHTLNLLDAQNAVSQTNRADYILKIRNSVNRICFTLLN